MERLREKHYHYQEEVNEGILRHIPFFSQEKKRLLDVGCGRAALSAAIKERGYEVWGIEQDPGAAGSAGKRIDRVIQADLTDTESVRAQLGELPFDALVFSDVLEHVYDPFSILKEYLGFLRPGALIYISVPNALSWFYRLSFLFGRFAYADTGVMDRTHIRFFTFKTAKRLLENAGCEVLIVDYTPFVTRAFLPLIKRFFAVKGVNKDGSEPQEIMQSPLYKWYMKYGYPLEYWIFSWWKSMFGFRIILVAKKV
ncbi:MAG: class I SAM-dependent methyltransferase [Candidatus Magasanikbacteria bacterium]|nr:class I SAM-dependent methyltransferase [Candidatus Magasanikbacteria bacterium]